MSLFRAVAAELIKIVTLPGTWAAVAIATLGSAGISLLNAHNIVDRGRREMIESASAIDAAFSALPLGTIGAVIIGVVVISSEYAANSTDAGGGRQITATLTAVNRRWIALAAKILTVVLVVSVMAALAVSVSIAAAHVIIGDLTPMDITHDAVRRAIGLALYWALMALISLAITLLTRNGIIPVIVLIANSSLVSVSLLLTKVTTLARFLPDLAGIRLFNRDVTAFDDPLGAVPGGLVMGAWAAMLIIISAVVFTRRDA